MSKGSQIAFYGGDLEKLSAELSIAQPTVFGAVPRTLNKLFDKVNVALNAPGCISSVKKSLITYCMAKKRAYLDGGMY